MSIREEQCNKVCRILDDVLTNRPTERDSLIVAVRKAFEALELFGNSEQLPSAQPEPEWIPVSERLPEEYEYVLLCDRKLEPDEDTGYSRMAVGWLEDGKFCCWDDRVARKEFVAWMPLPKPYKEGEHE